MAAPLDGNDPRALRSSPPGNATVNATISATGSNAVAIAVVKRAQGSLYGEMCVFFQYVG